MRLFLLFMALINLVHADIYATFDVLAEKEANLAFSTSGTIEQIYVEVGSRVKKNQLLAKLENSDLKAQLALANANQEEARVALKFAKRDFERQKKIKSVIDERHFDKYHLNYERAKALYAQSKARVAYAQSMLDKSLLRAPFDGVISTKEIEVGDVVSGQMIKVAFVINSHARKLLLKFDSKYQQTVKKGDLFAYQIDAQEKKYQGTISKLYPTISENMMRAEVQTKDMPIGLFGTGYIKD